MTEMSTMGSDLVAPLEELLPVVFQAARILEHLPRTAAVGAVEHPHVAEDVVGEVGAQGHVRDRDVKPLLGRVERREVDGREEGVGEQRAAEAQVLALLDHAPPALHAQVGVVDLAPLVDGHGSGQRAARTLGGALDQPAHGVGIHHHVRLDDQQRRPRLDCFALRRAQRHQVVGRGGVGQIGQVDEPEAHLARLALEQGRIFGGTEVVVDRIEEGLRGPRDEHGGRGLQGQVYGILHRGDDVQARRATHPRRCGAPVVWLPLCNWHNSFDLS